MVGYMINTLYNVNCVCVLLNVLLCLYSERAKRPSQMPIDTYNHDVDDHICLFTQYSFTNIKNLNFKKKIFDTIYH